MRVTQGQAPGDIGVPAFVIFGNDPLSISLNPFLLARDEQVLLTFRSQLDANIAASGWRHSS